MLQADDEDDMMEMQMKSPFGSSFRTFNATDYKPIGEAFCLQFALDDFSTLQGRFSIPFTVMFAENDSFFSTLQPQLMSRGIYLTFAQIQKTVTLL